MSAPWPVGAATGLGPMPGTDVTESAAAIAGELPELPFVPALSSRGVGADPVGKAVALLVDLYAEVVPSGWRLTDRPGRDTQRAADFRRWDDDAVAERYAGAPRIKVQLLGPWTLATRLELRSGHRAVADAGAVADLVESYAEGVRGHLRELAERLPGVEQVLQVDEPELLAVLAGRLPTPSGLGTLRAVPLETVRDTLADFVQRLERPTIGSGIEAGSGWKLLRDTGFDAMVVDLADLSGSRTALLDGIGEAVQAGMRLLVTLDGPRSVRGSDPDAAVTTAGRQLLAAWRRIGFDPDALAGAVVPTAGPDLEHRQESAAVAAMQVAGAVGAALLDPPASWR